VLEPPARPGLLASLDRFEVLRLIGVGGMGVVVLARDPHTSERVAIKLLKPELVPEPQAVHRFLIEARHMQRFTHPSILRVREVSDRSEGPYFVMPYLERGSLAGLIRTGEPLDGATALQIAEDVASALVYAHAKGLIHRDLKPGNVLLDAEGRAYLADFGLLRTFFNDSIIGVRREQCEGTPAYMSPAVAAGQAEDTRCDIYSFGALLYEMLTGLPPYEGRSPQEIRTRILAGPPMPILQHNPKAPPNLVRIAEWAMARELRDRYAQMADCLADLQRVGKGETPLGPHGRPAASEDKSRLGGLKRALLPAGLVLGILGASAVGIIAFLTPGLWPSPAERPERLAPLGAEWADGLRLVDPGKHAFDSEWEVMAAGLQVTADTRHGRVAIPVRPAGAYEIRASFVRTQGSGLVAVCLPAGTTSCVLQISAHNGRVSGLEYIDGKDVGISGANVKPGPLENGRPYDLTVKVLPDKKAVEIVVFLDGAPYLQWKGPVALLTNPVWPLIGYEPCPGVGATECTILFRSVQVRSLAGAR